MWYSRRPKALTTMWQSPNYHREYPPNWVTVSFSYSLLDTVTGNWECLWCNAVALQRWNVKGTAHDGKSTKWWLQQALLWLS
jgi:hypothetical protein